MPTIKSFLQIVGVNGDSKDPKHPGWIDLMSWNLEQPQIQASGPGGSGPQRSLKEFYFTMRMGALSQSLRKAAENGTNFREVVLEVIKDDRLVKQIRFGSVYLTSSALQPSNGTHNDPRLATFWFDFETVEASFGEESQKGPVDRGGRDRYQTSRPTAEAGRTNLDQSKPSSGRLPVLARRPTL
jgi:type VI protein secretion system component Hcp